MFFFEVSYIGGPVLIIQKGEARCVFTLQTSEPWTTFNMLDAHSSFTLHASSADLQLSPAEMADLQDSIRGSLIRFVQDFHAKIRLVPRYYKVRKLFQKMPLSHARVRSTPIEKAENVAPYVAKRTNMGIV